MERDYSYEPTALQQVTYEPAIIETSASRPNYINSFERLNRLNPSCSTSSPSEEFHTPPSQQQVYETNLPPSSHGFLHEALNCVCCSISPVIASILALVLSTALVWGTLLGLLKYLALPGGHIFALFILVIACYITGELITFIKLPSLLGMLLMGIILQNVPYINIARDLDPFWTSDLRSMALVIILLRAGLGLDPNVLKQISFVCFRLAFTPCLIECVVLAIASHFLLGFPWLWGFILGFVVAAVSPAVVVPSMLSLQEKKLGVNKGIPTLVIAAASVDDVLAITGFGVIIGIVFSKGNLAWTIVKGPLEALLGVIYGCIFGWIMWFVPHAKDSNVNLLRVTQLLFGGLFAMFGGRAIEFGGIGAIGCLTLAFVAGIGWRKEALGSKTDVVASTLATLWQLFQPILFGLIGTEIKVETLHGNTIGLGIAALGICIFFRMLTSFIVVSKSGLSLREQLFIAIAWLPKATVQAAIGPVALDYARQLKDFEHYEQLGIQVLTIAVLSILCTAPIGAAAIALAAPRLLETTERDSSHNSNYGSLSTSSLANKPVIIEDDKPETTNL